MQSPEVNVKCLPLLPSTFSFETGSLIELGDHQLATQAGQPCGHRHIELCPAFVWVLGKFLSCVCIVSSLATDSSLGDVWSYSMLTMSINSIWLSPTPWGLLGQFSGVSNRCLPKEREAALARDPDGGKGGWAKDSRCRHSFSSWCLCTPLQLPLKLWCSDSPWVQKQQNKELTWLNSWEKWTLPLCSHNITGFVQTNSQHLGPVGGPLLLRAES